MRFPPEIQMLSSNSLHQESKIYKCLEALHHASFDEFQRNIQESLKGIMYQLKSSAVHTNTELLMSLVSLSEFQDVSVVLDRGKDFTSMIRSWQVTNHLLLSNYDFNMYESNMACRTQLIATYTSATKTDCGPFLSDHILEYSKACRKNGFLQGSISAIYHYQSINPGGEDSMIFGIQGLKGILERLKILWLQDEKLLAIKFLKDTIRNIKSNLATVDEISEDLGRCYCLIGQWIAETKSENFLDVINLYFTPGIKNTSNLGKNHYNLLCG